MFSSIINLSILFFFLFAAPASIPIFISHLKMFSAKRQRLIIIREMLLALALIFAFILGGDSFFKTLNISLPVFQLVGGSLLFTVAFKMAQANPFIDSPEQTKEQHAPFFFPLAFPVVTGPAVLTNLVAHIKEGITPVYIVITAILIAWLLSSLVLLVSELTQRFFGLFPILWIEKIFGTILLTLSIHILIKGMLSLFTI